MDDETNLRMEGTGRYWTYKLGYGMGGRALVRVESRMSAEMCWYMVVYN